MVDVDRFVQQPRVAHRVRVEASRQHLKSLLAAGMTVQEVSDRCGLPPPVVHRLLAADPPRWVSSVVHRSVLSTRPPVASGSLVPAVGSVRRVRALVSLGWTYRQLASLAGLDHSQISELAAGRASAVRRRTADRVATLYERWSMVLPPPSDLADRTRAEALSRGWEPPLAWDDDALDDPHASPFNGDVLDEA